MPLANAASVPIDLPSINYLLIGHLSEDSTPKGPGLGGTVAYAGLTAWALGRRVGLVTSAADSLDLSPLQPLALRRKPSSVSTSFENQYTPAGRVQTLRSRAAALAPSDVPGQWRNTEIVHLGPIADEVSLELAASFPDSFVGLTPQGSLRSWDSAGRVRQQPWTTIRELLEVADAVVLSLEDLQMEQAAVRALAGVCDTLVVTEAAQGATLYEKGRGRHVPGLPVAELDPTGSGDIFAAVFFVRLHATGDPWEAAQLANRIAANSVTRAGLAGAPTPQEARSLLEAAGAR